MNIDELIKSEDFETLSSEFAKKSLEKLFEDVRNEIETFALEQYDNIKSKIENDLISQIADEYGNEPDAYKFSQLRKKLFIENKEETLKLLTNEVIEENLERILLGRCDEKYYFHWEWKDAIAKFILSNWDILKDDKRFDFALRNEIEKLQNQINYIQKELNESKKESES